MGSRSITPDGGDLDINTTDEMKQQPRIDITMSMMYAYANMRGKPPTEFDPDFADPLHSSLYPDKSRSREHVQQEVHLPGFDVGGMLSGYEPPLGTRYFWDPVKAKRLMAHKLQSFLKRPLTGLRKAMKRDSGYMSWSNDFTDHPATLAPNHYKGADVWANFGYVKINGRWVDPESDRELSAAYKGAKEDHHYVATLSVVNKPRCPGPRVMTDEEADSLYKWYSDEVSSGDTEGDPRKFRITPDIFAFWAQGAKKGEHYERRILEPQEPVPRAQYDMEGIRPPRIMPRLQFNGDSDNRSMMTGEYEVEEAPLILHGSLGANMTRPPEMLSHMAPLDCLELEKAHFLGPRDKSALNSPTASTAESFTTERVGQYFSPEEPTAGIFEAWGRINQVNYKQYIRDATIGEHLCRRDAVVEHRKKLNKEVDEIEKNLKWLKEAIAKREATRVLTPRDNGTKKLLMAPQIPSPTREAQMSISSGSPTSTRASDTQSYISESPSQDLTLSHPQRSLTLFKALDKGKGQYRRYFKDLAEKEKILESQARDAHEALSCEYDDIVEEIHLLYHCKKELQDALEEAQDTLDALDAAELEEANRQHRFDDLYAGPYEDAKDIEEGGGLKS